MNTTNIVINIYFNKSANESKEDVEIEKAEKGGSTEER